MWTKEEEIKIGLRKLHNDNLRNVYERRQHNSTNVPNGFEFSTVDGSIIAGRFRTASRLRMSK
jgi:hypothetical protein